MPSTYNGLSEEWYFQLDSQILHVIPTRLMLRAIPSYSTSLREIRSEEIFATGYFLLRNAIRLCSLIKYPSQNHISITEYPVDLPAIADDKLVITTENLYQFIISGGPKSDAGSIFWADIISDLLDSGIQSNVAPKSLEADVSFARRISKPEALWNMPLFSDVSEDFSPQNIEYEIALLLEVLVSNGPEMQFWHDWYQGFLDGKPLDWGLQREVALIPDADWDKGPAHIAEVIEEIRKKYNRNLSAEPSLEDQIKSISAKAKSTISKNIAINRDALAVSIAGLNEQLTAFQEKVRGLNHLDPEFRVELLDYLNGLSKHLNHLLRDLPTTDDPISDKQAGKFVLWLREFKPLIAQKSRAYIAPENISEAVIPTGIILGCTGIGSMLGMPLAGTVVGGLITGQIKPGKAASDLFKSDKPDTGEES